MTADWSKPRRLAIEVPFPLRGDFVASVIVPRDLTNAEADRLIAFVKSLVAENEGES